MGMRVTILKLLVAGCVAIISQGSANAAPLFWAINQFTTVQQLNGDTGAVVQSFAVPSFPGFSNPSSIAVVGNTGYFTQLQDANVYKVDMTTHGYLGIAFDTGLSIWMNDITVDANQHLWFAHGGSGVGNVLQEFDPVGNLLSTHAFPDAAFNYRDGSVVFGGSLIANRGDQRGPYDKYAIPGGNGALSYVAMPFIVDPVQDSGNNGIAFNGVNFYVSNEALHQVCKYDAAGVFISCAPLDIHSRYENWTFAAEDIVAVPEPATLALLAFGLAALGFSRRRKLN